MASIPHINKVPTQPQQAEDAAGEGGEAVATFANYVAPAWAYKLFGHNTKAHAKKQAERKPNVIVVDSDIEASQDCSDDNNDKESVIENKKIKSHTSPACESGLLASVAAPKPGDESLKVIQQLANDGLISPLQVEGCSLAIQRHCRLFPPNGPGQCRVRAGFFLGDGAGVGKGRQIAGVLRDSFSRSKKDSDKQISSRRRHLWISVSRELLEDAKRDLNDIGCHAPVYDGVDVLGGAGSNSGKSNSSGVLFSTYAFLVSGKGKRLDDIIAWLTHSNNAKAKTQYDLEQKFDGCIILDEAHKAKNLCADPPTATGRLVLELQNRLPNARVMYCSATGVSDLSQMAYAVRLGLWGPGTNFPTFDMFKQSLEKRGVGAMEMLALEMKQSGSFVARTLSWDGAEFNTVQVSLSDDLVNVYDLSVKWWNRVKEEMESIVKVPAMNGTPKNLWRIYWSAHQRFFKEIAICAKISYVVADARSQLDAGNSVIIGLQSTGEASTQAALDELTAEMMASQNGTNKKAIEIEDVCLSTLLSTAGAIMKGFLRGHFPVAPIPLEPPKLPPSPQASASEYEKVHYQQTKQLADKINNMPPPKPIAAFLQKRQALIDLVSDIPLPPAPLDNLIDQLGGIENVSEMTGRSGRIIRDTRYRKSGDDSFRFAKRSGQTKENKYGLSMPQSEEDMERLNLVEKKKFMDGRKCVAIISDAASTGISLHAAANCQSRYRRRIHYTIELPWAADKAIQQLGRSHRSGQTSAPAYKMVVTELGGERRFAAAVAKRMCSLGALTKGDRRAATGSDLSEFDIDSRFGRRALKRFYDCMTVDPPYTPSRGSNSILDAHIAAASSPNLKEKDLTDQRLRVLEQAKIGLEEMGIDHGPDSRKDVQVKVFLNRIAGLTVAKQNLVFSLFMSTMDDVISEAKATGEYEGSVEDVHATTIELHCKPEEITVDSASGAKTKLTTFTVDRGVSFSQAVRMCLDCAPPNSKLNGEIEANDSVARTGFYVSKRKIMGRTLVLFAKRKIEVTEDDENDSNRIDYDPMGLMVVTRPNTGTNPFEMPTGDLHHKYRLIASLDDVKNIANEESSVDDVVGVMQSKFIDVFNIWKQTYIASDIIENNVGLAARHSRFGMVTGAVLHCLLALERVVAGRKMAERSLKVIRVEITSTGQRLVGVKFPVDDLALTNLRSTMTILKAARAGMVGEGLVAFIDDSPEPVQERSVIWLTTKPKTMQSFFGSVNNPKDKIMKTNSNVGRNDFSLIGVKRKEPICPIPMSNNNFASSKKTSTFASGSKKKSKSITSFFKQS